MTSFQKSAFQKYWENLKNNNPEKYERRLQLNRDKQRTKRHKIYKDKILHENFKAENRRKYAERVARRRKVMQAAESILKQMNAN